MQLKCHALLHKKRGLHRTLFFHVFALLFCDPKIVDQQNTTLSAIIPGALFA